MLLAAVGALDAAGARVLLSGELAVDIQEALRNRCQFGIPADEHLHTDTEADLTVDPKKGSVVPSQQAHTVQSRTSDNTCVEPRLNGARTSITSAP